MTTNMVSETLEVHWKKPSKAEGFVDVLCMGLFLKEGTRENQFHQIINEKRKPSGWAQFVLHVFENTAILDYAPYQAYNDENDILIGSTRIHFADATRRRLHKTKKIEWAEFEEAPVEPKRVKETK